MLPVETNYALFPRRIYKIRLGAYSSVTLHSATLRHAAVMENFDCGLLCGDLTPSQSLMAAWILTLSRQELDDALKGKLTSVKKFLKRAKGNVHKIVFAVSEIMKEASLPFVAPKCDDDGGWKLDDGLPEGFGWPLEVAEALCAHYGWSFDEAFDTEVSRAFALIAVSRQRSGGSHGGPDYYERIRLERMKMAGIIPHGKGAL